MRATVVLLALMVASSVALAGCHETFNGDPSDPGDTGGSGTGSTSDPSPSDPQSPPPPPPPPPPPSPPPDEDTSSDVSFRTLADGQQSAYRTIVRAVFTNETEWAGFWENHTSEEMPPPERPAVDFAVERVAAVILGDRPNGCYAVAITSATAEGTETRIHVTEYVPHEDMFCPQVITQPFHFVALPADGTRIVFEESVVEQEPPE